MFLQSIHLSHMSPDRLTHGNCWATHDVTNHCSSEEGGCWAWEGKGSPWVGQVLEEGSVVLYKCEAWVTSRASLLPASWGSFGTRRGHRGSWVACGMQILLWWRPGTLMCLWLLQCPERTWRREEAKGFKEEFMMEKGFHTNWACTRGGVAVQRLGEKILAPGSLYSVPGSPPLIRLWPGASHLATLFSQLWNGDNSPTACKLFRREDGISGVNLRVAVIV